MSLCDSMNTIMFIRYPTQYVREGFTTKRGSHLLSENVQSGLAKNNRKMSKMS